MGKVVAVCISDKKGTQKINIKSCFIKLGWGLENDAHGGNWHRQVSLLSIDKVKMFSTKDMDIKAGVFGENILAEGIDFAKLPTGTLIKCGDALLEITQIGKECHNKCIIHHQMGDCIMPREGVFAKVLQDGNVTEGDDIKIILSAAVITLSDKGSKGERLDQSGMIISEQLSNAGYFIASKVLLPDDKSLIEKSLIELSDNNRVQLIITTGGTGLAVRDVTPEATIAIATREVPGIAEAIRYHSLKKTPRAMLSRGVAVIRNQTLIVNLPGSPKAVSEILEYILPSLTHGVEILCGIASECGETV